MHTKKNFLINRAGLYLLVQYSETSHCEHTPLLWTLSWFHLYLLQYKKSPKLWTNLTP